MGTMGEVVKVAAGFAVVTILTILADRWLSNRAAIGASCHFLCLDCLVGKKSGSYSDGHARISRQP